MIDALISGRLIKATVLKTGQSGKHYIQFMLSVSIGEPQPIAVSCIGFGEVAERIAKLDKGDALAVTGALKPTEWQDKATGAPKHGLNVTVSDCLSAYQVKKRRGGGD